MVAFERLLTTKTRLVAITHSSNMLGTSVDVATIVHKAHAVGAYVLVDAAQSVPHQAVNVQQLACDFLVFSGHKILGPTGIGVLFVREALHDKLQPFRYGGGMFQLRHDDHCVWAKSPYKFEAGTPPIAQALGLAAALNYLAQTMSFADVVAYEAQLMRAVIDGLQQIARVRVLGPIDQLKKNGHVVSFVVDGIHAHDVAAFLDQQTPSVAVRAGQHCAQLVHDMLAIPASVRLSFYLYNTQEEIDIFLNHMKKLVF
jgi:cysteine desulfurase/selenocysteine lyase